MLLLTREIDHHAAIARKNISYVHIVRYCTIRRVHLFYPFDVIDRFKRLVAASAAAVGSFFLRNLAVGIGQATGGGVAREKSRWRLCVIFSSLEKVVDPR